MENEVIEPQEVTQTPEQQQAAEQEQAKKEVPEWATRRFGELTAARKEAERRAAEAEQRLQQFQLQQPTGEGQAHQPVHANVDALARVYAETIADEKIKQQEFNRSLKSIEDHGRQEFGEEFDRSISNLGMAGVGGVDFLNVLGSLPNPAKVVHWLGRPENMGEAVRIGGLAPVQMAIELAQLAPKAAKEVARAVSKAPAPITPIDGVVSADGAPKLGTQEWFEHRNKTARRR